MSEPTAVLRAWFEAHAAGDTDRARTLLAPDALMRVPGQELRGFDAFMAWYDERRRSTEGFRYEVLDVLGGTDHAAAVIRLTDSRSSWRQVAVYEVDDGRISAMTAYEDEPRP